MGVQDHRRVGFPVGLLKGEIAHAVCNEFALIDFEALQYVRMMTNHQVSAQFDGALLENAIRGIRIRFEANKLFLGQRLRQRRQLGQQRRCIVFGAGVHLHHDQIAQRIYGRDRRFQRRLVEHGKAGLVVTRFQEGRQEIFAAVAIAIGKNAHANAIHRDKCRTSRPIVVQPRAGELNGRRIQHLDGFPQPRFHVVHRVIVPQGRVVEPREGQPVHRGGGRPIHNFFGGVRVPLPVSDVSRLIMLSCAAWPNMETVRWKM